MTRALPLLVAAAALAACSSTPAADPASPPPAAEAAPPEGPEPGLRAPGFRFAATGGGAGMSLEEALAAQKGRPLVLVLGDATCSVSTRELEDLAAGGAAGPGGGEAAFLAVVKGSPAEVAETVPPGTRFPVLVDEAGGVLDRYRVVATPSVVVLDGKGRIAYIGEGGYIAPEQVVEMAGRAAQGLFIDPAKVRLEGG